MQDDTGILEPYSNNDGQQQQQTKHTEKTDSLSLSHQIIKSERLYKYRKAFFLHFSYSLNS